MKKIFIERKRDLLRIAIKEKGILSECFVEERSLEPQVGEIYKGRVKNIIPAINSVFVDIGLQKEGYMYLSNELKSEGIKKGDDILVEVLKEPLNNKGAKLTKNVSISGEFMVLTLGGYGVSFSKRITNSNEKERLSEVINPIDGYEIILRTDSINATNDELLEEQNNLLSKMDVLKRKLHYSLNLGKVYGENIILNKVLRDKIDDETSILVNNEEDYNQIKEFLNDEKKDKVSLFNEERGLLHYYGIEKEILKLRHNKVNLPCGGNIVIEKTEAMYVIDVNTGKNIKGRSFDKTILETNVEAAKEIGRQIRLRNLSGIIVIDFIDVRNKSHKSIIMNTLREALAPDKGNVKVFPFTELDLVQIARKRIGKSIYNYLDEPCKRCKGQGEVLKIAYIENLLENEIIKCNEENSITDFYIELDKNYQEEVEGNMFSFLKNIQGLDKEIYLNFVDGIEGYKIEPLIFNSQKENVKNFKVKAYEKCE
ncbi:Rne/Rng family ribonuclease [Clostridium chauvoei]|uniref:Rne/Rng family ribonuclease n=2 Tax=Clostridium chauvoei TaxID=46867 RepID=A0ABD4RG22_9CLOT|nr:Rne/Rng family ribonuclease [Clostridium chauvoei]ATD55858.1 ribonuclease [Clostridium chauvoei]ATD56470.1 ribonuclease [Clostridium chauvoei]MBX7280219.1 Rne/Rng family ribonuclease [Clostridium chauvoei]MBX7282671.1 Rne/Rng family ribonuclease [Clostridium chauvoei]MBX7285110.1 Rne/Rng family ribonuclease [Clostridium chauvoei]